MFSTTRSPPFRVGLDAMIRRLVATLLLIGMATACAAQGPEDQPVVRRLAWFSYVGGDDLRADCRPGPRALIRLVYNAIYTEQVRTYDIAWDAEREAGRLTARVFGGGNLMGLTLGDPFSPWRGVGSETRLPGADLRAIRRILEKSGFFERTQAGLFLRSDGFYWTVSSCLGGTFHFNAFAAPSPTFERQQFLELLSRYDRTGVSPNPVRPVYFAPLTARYQRKPEHFGPIFQLEVGENGLLGAPLFR